jgi:phosphohistidine phosphatase
VARLLLLRHAKSSWSDASLRDHDRPLNGRGRRAAASMGAHLRARDWLPDLVLCSSARRTCETAALLDLPADTAVEIEHDLYLADADDVFARVSRVDDAIGSLMVIGHNPTMHEVALDLARAGDPSARSRLASAYPTGALALFDVDVPWRELEPGSARLTNFVVPRDLTD